MKIFKHNQLFIVPLMLAIAFCFPIAFASAQNNNQADVNKNQINVNEDQADINENQADINAEQNKINEKQKQINKSQAEMNEGRGNGKLNGEQHRSAVATFVKSLLEVVDREEGGIGEQVKVVANEQNDSKDNVADSIDAIQNRSSIKTFLIGTDYKNVGQLRSEMVKTGNQIEQLKGLVDEATSEESKVDLQNQIQTLEQQQQKINDFLKTNESKFSLLGWFVKLFY